MIQKVFAHEEETHESSTEAATHYIETFDSPFFAVPAFFVSLVLIYILLTKYTPLHRGAKLLIMLGYLFFITIIGFLFVPVLGMIAIVMGFGFAGMLALAGIKQ